MTAPCTPGPGYVIHRPGCPEYARLGVTVDRDQWFGIGTTGGHDDDWAEDELADWESARVYGGGRP